MRIPLLIAIGIIMISIASGASDCTAIPQTGSMYTWCTDCFDHTYSELVCNKCNSQHINVEKTNCVDYDCTVTQTTYSSDWCNACDLTKKVASSDQKSCVVATTDCSVKPTSATKSSWCNSCKVNVVSELVCSVCDSMFLNYDSTGCINSNCSVKPVIYTTLWCSECEKVNKFSAIDGKSCVNIDCSVKPTNNYTDNWCSACDLTNKVAASDFKSCVAATSDCSVQPTSATKSSWCNSCKFKVISELVCSVCDSMHANYDSTRCINYDCSVKPTSYTASWCSACEKVNQTAASDGKSCVNIDCSLKPTNSYSDDWCNACSSPPTKALSDKSACSKGTTTTTTSTKTSSTILQSLIVALFALIAII